MAKSTGDGNVTSEWASLAAVGAAVLTAACAAYLASPSRPRDAATRRRESLIAYLRDHLGASESAIQVVHRLGQWRRAPDDAMLFRRLEMEFEEEQTAVRSVLNALGASSHSVKRAAGAIAGTLLAAGSGGEAGTLSLFRTLESLAVAVQGKRCLWRALHALNSGRPLVARVNFLELEGQAMRQWDAIERRRMELVASTFSAGPPALPARLGQAGDLHR